ncbi:unnamed protein product [Lupinus luteus]|uniref:Uncharacterized protein n=1 Tax=Lupinus luteus TaxID=3873 RepID=A0AAV1YBU9_LUPLU
MKNHLFVMERDAHATTEDDELFDDADLKFPRLKLEPQKLKIYITYVDYCFAQLYKIFTTSFLSSSIEYGHFATCFVQTRLTGIS